MYCRVCLNVCNSYHFKHRTRYCVLFLLDEHRNDSNGEGSFTCFFHHGYNEFEEIIQNEIKHIVNAVELILNLISITIQKFHHFVNCFNFYSLLIQRTR
jgi:hypothetical protein